jgi:hypothetical protein
VASGAGDVVSACGRFGESVPVGRFHGACGQGYSGVGLWSAVLPTHEPFAPPLPGPLPHFVAEREKKSRASHGSGAQCAKEVSGDSHPILMTHSRPLARPLRACASQWSSHSCYWIPAIEYVAFATCKPFATSQAAQVSTSWRRRGRYAGDMQPLSGLGVLFWAISQGGALSPSQPWAE